MPDRADTNLFLLILARDTGRPSGIENNSVNTKIDTVTPIPPINNLKITSRVMYYFPMQIDSGIPKSEYLAAI